MTLINQPYKIIIAFLSSLFAGYMILTNNYIIAFILLLGFLYCVLLTWEQKFTLFSLTVFFPLAFSHLGPIQEFKWIEILAPILCVLFIVDNLDKRQPFFSKKSFLFFIAISVLSLLVLINYVKKPVSGQMLFGASYREAGIRSYYTIFVGVATFLCSFWFFRYKNLNVKRWLMILLIISLALGYLRLIGYFQNFYIPFMEGVFRYEIPEWHLSFFRIGGLSEVATLGITILLVLFYKKNWNFISIVLFISFLVLLFFSGGRASFFGSMLAIIIYIILINKKYLFRFSFSLLIFLGIYYLLNLFIPLSNQINRLIAVKGGFAQQDLYRYSTFRYYWDIFLNNPFWGKGIGYIQNVTIAGNQYGEFISGQLMGGGHGSYLSILCTFGIGGGFYLVVMLFGSMYYAYRVFKSNIDVQDNSKLALFVFLYLIILSIMFIPGGTGYNSMELWFLSGVIAGLNSKNEVIDVKS